MRIALRYLTLVALYGAALGAVHLMSNDNDAGAAIGVGILEFLAVAAICGTWAIFDGMRDLRQALITWGVVAVVYAVSVPFFIAISDGSLDWSVLRSDLATLGPFTLMLVAAPAAVGAVIGHAIRPTPAPTS
ncbi:hypothetical protein [Nocardioides speluncae]|uniref:hypothetical protein n=1 Tax=Nocardioides speluncae TaxID=2670337 RepID=UPI000D68FD4C|nr:hypothetical protein [Nocardioides speluncae]